MDKELTILYLKLLNRKPSSVELKEYLNKLINGELSIHDIESILKQAAPLTVKYDQSLYEIEVNPLSTDTYDGAILSNGKLFVKSGKTPEESGVSEITSVYNEEELGYHNTNMIPAFKFTGLIFFFTDTQKPVSSSLVQRLNIHTAYFEMSYNVDHTIDDVPCSMQVKQQMRALRQYPYCFLNTVTITNIGVSKSEIELFHVHEQSGLNLTGISHSIDILNYNYIYSSSGSDIYRNMVIHVGSLYKLSDPSTLSSISLNDSDGKSVIKLLLDVGQSVSIDIITCMMTSMDFVKPNAEIRRILMNIMDDNLVLDHNKEWMSIWNNSNLSISKKTDIPTEKINLANESINIYQKNIKFSLYNIFSILRDDVNVDNNILNLSAVDSNGEIFYNAEMFLIPILLLLHPSYAKVLLDFRYKQIEFAKNVASVYKHKGAQYPYREDISKYKDVFWSPDKPAVAFNTGLIGINTWNYYRVSKDKYWFLEKGFVILQNCARYFHSLFDDDYELVSVQTIGGFNETDNALSRYLAITVLRFYIEACYDCNYNVDENIYNLYNNIKNNVVDLIGELVSPGNTTMPLRISITKDENSNIEIYATDTNTLLGVNISSLNGNQLKVVSDQRYTININSKVFLKFYDRSGRKIELDDLLSRTILYSSDHGFTDGNIEIEGSQLSSFEDGTNRFNDVFFTNEEDVILHNIINRPESVIDTPNKVLETHMILMNFYSRMFFKSINPVSKVEIIKDNLSCFKPISQDINSRLIVNNLECLLAQELGLTNDKDFYINKFNEDIEQIFSNENVHISKPWGNHNSHVLFIFNLLTSMLKFKIKGSITDKRLYTEQFGVYRDIGGSVMPEYWKAVTVTYDKKTLVIPNTR